MERRQIFPGSPEWKERGNRRGDQQVRILLDTLVESEAPGLVPCHLFRSPGNRSLGATEDALAWEEAGGTCPFLRALSTARRKALPSRCFRAETEF